MLSACDNAQSTAGSANLKLGDQERLDPAIWKSDTSVATNLDAEWSGRGGWLPSLPLTGSVTLGNSTLLCSTFLTFKMHIVIIFAF